MKKYSNKKEMQLILEDHLTILACPICHENLDYLDDIPDGQLICQNIECKCVFPIFEDIPILLNEKRSLFINENYKINRKTTKQYSNTFKKKALSLLPSLSKNLGSKKNYGNFQSLLLQSAKYPKILVIGGKVEGVGMENLFADQNIEMIETDVEIGPNTQYVCDGHYLPFRDRIFDGAIAQAVLEHVVDPNQVVSEINRVLKPEGFVYSEVPFLQPGHEKAYDFSRFTLIGHRRLFRYFEEIDSGVVCGPGMALAQMYEYFLLSFFVSRIWRQIIRAFARLTAFWLKYFDPILIKKPGCIDAASGTYFLGKKSLILIPDSEIVKVYRGAQ